jgi:hypothetical protein
MGLNNRSGSWFWSEDVFLVQPGVNSRPGEQRPRYTGCAGLPRPQEHPAHGSLHRAVAGSVQGLLALMWMLPRAASKPAGHSGGSWAGDQPVPLVSGKSSKTKAFASMPIFSSTFLICISADLHLRQPRSARRRPHGVPHARSLASVSRSVKSTVEERSAVNPLKPRVYSGPQTLPR